MQRAKLKVPDQGEWWSGKIDVPANAELLDFVFSDTEKRVWDNNRNRDYHVPILNSLPKEQLIQVIALPC